MNISKLSSWIRRRPGETTKLVLVYLSQSDTEEKVTEWRLSELRDEHPDTIAALVLEAAQDDCDEREIAGRWALRACNDSPDGILRQQVLKCYPSEAESDPLAIGDVAKMNTGLSQMVRMNEVFIRLWVQGQGALINGYRELLKTQSDEIRSLRRREEIASEIIRRAAEEVSGADEGSAERSLAISRLVDLAEKYAPAVIGKMAGVAAAGGDPIPPV